MRKKVRKRPAEEEVLDLDALEASADMETPADHGSRKARGDRAAAEAEARAEEQRKRRARCTPQAMHGMHLIKQGAGTGPRQRPRRSPRSASAGPGARPLPVNGLRGRTAKRLGPEACGPLLLCTARLDLLSNCMLTAWRRRYDTALEKANYAALAQQQQSAASAAPEEEEAEADDLEAQLARARWATLFTACAWHTGSASVAHRAWLLQDTAGGSRPASPGKR